jgi:hypothetical protein
MVEKKLVIITKFTPKKMEPNNKEYSADEKL